MAKPSEISLFDLIDQAQEVFHGGYNAAKHDAFKMAVSGCKYTPFDNCGVPRKNDQNKDNASRALQEHDNLARKYPQLLRDEQFIKDFAKRAYVKFHDAVEQGRTLVFASGSAAQVDHKYKLFFVTNDQNHVVQYSDLDGSGITALPRLPLQGTPKVDSVWVNDYLWAELGPYLFRFNFDTGRWEFNDPPVSQISTAGGKIYGLATGEGAPHFDFKKGELLFLRMHDFPGNTPDAPWRRVEFFAQPPGGFRFFTLDQNTWHFIMDDESRNPGMVQKYSLSDEEFTLLDPQGQDRFSFLVSHGEDLFALGRETNKIYQYDGERFVNKTRRDEINYNGFTVLRKEDNSDWVYGYTNRTIRRDVITSVEWDLKPFSEIELSDGTVPALVASRM